jgi:hypothetical protein
MRIEIDKTEVKGATLIVNGRIDDKPTVARGSSIPFVSAKSTAHATRYAVMLLQRTALQNAKGADLEEGGQVVTPNNSELWAVINDLADRVDQLENAPPPSITVNPVVIYPKQPNLWKRIVRFFLGDA